MSDKSLNTCNGSKDAFIRHIVNEMDEIVYVSDPDTYELLFLNDLGKKLFNIECCSGRKCYQALHKLSAPCPFCKNEFLNLDDFFVWEFQTEDNGYYLIRDKLIRWDDRLLRLGIANDIIQKKMLSQNLHHKLKNEQILLKCVHILGDKDEFAEAADIILGHLGEYYDADRAYIFECKLDDDGRVIANNTHEWCSCSSPSKKDFLQNIPVAHFSLWKNQVENCTNIIIDSVEKIKDDHPNDYVILKQLGVERLMVVPLKMNDKVSGFIGIDNPKTCHHDYSLLRSLALVVTNEQKKRAMAHRLMKMSYTDKLTGLGNRNHYMHTLEQLEKTPPPNLGVVFIDLNGLKLINDKHGHIAGDEYIKNLADIFRKHFREEDIYRIGGDEFVLLTQRIREVTFREKIRALKKEAHALYPDSVSLGAVWQEKNIRPANMIKKADFLMYEDKKEYYRRLEAQSEVS